MAAMQETDVARINQGLLAGLSTAPLFLLVVTFAPASVHKLIGAGILSIIADHGARSVIAYAQTDTVYGIGSFIALLLLHFPMSCIVPKMSISSVPLIISVLAAYMFAAVITVFLYYSIRKHLIFCGQKVEEQYVQIIVSPEESLPTAVIGFFHKILSGYIGC